MTAEVAIMNKECVALAADSAVTLSNEKIFTSSNKIFRISSDLPMGLMIYNRADFMGVPWETVIKLYRIHLENNNQRFDKLFDCVDNFISFLILEFKNTQDSYFQKESVNFLSFIRGDIWQNEQMGKHFKGSDLTPGELSTVAKRVIAFHYTRWEESEKISSLTDEDILNIEKKYSPFLEEQIKRIYIEVPLDDELISNLKKIAISIFVKDSIFSPLFTGLVISGFGDKELFPSLKTIVVFGVVNDKLHYAIADTNGIDNANVPASVSAFAQNEMVDTFMKGINPKYAHEVDSCINHIFHDYPLALFDFIEKTLKDKQILTGIDDSVKTEIKSQLQKIGDVEYQKCVKGFSEYQFVNHIKNILDVVAYLPKDEVALMAESLVNLTSFKLKISMQAPSVSGPIDVAVISKKDGFVWIKRKHYFPKELNPQFGVDMYDTRK
jgi:hypothetical protein